MPRRIPRIAPQALAVTVLVAVAWLASCQDYNFSPVRYCVIQPGTERVTLSDISTADVLFVVDDSGSMGGEQKKLQQSFAAFVSNLAETNKLRVQSRLEPIDFHIAVTTTSVFQSSQPDTRTTCSTSCGGTGSQAVCCKASNQPLKVPRGCTSAAGCTGNNLCLDSCDGRRGQLTCCASVGAQPEEIPVACSEVGQECGLITDRYRLSSSVRQCGQPIAGGGGALTSCLAGPNPDAPNPAPSGFSCRLDCNGQAGSNVCCADAAPHGAWLDADCDLGVARDGDRYPRGDFVRKGTNPRVLHFEKSLFCTRTGDGSACDCLHTVSPDVCDPPVVNQAAIDTLVAQFQQNVAVGTCGSGQEQGLEAAKLAIQKALGLEGLSQPAEDGGQAPAWPHPRRVVTSPERPSSKLVVVFVGDEDDCSSPEDPTRGIVFNGSGGDACALDGVGSNVPARRFKVQDYADFLSALGRPVAGAFIVSATAGASATPPCATPAACRLLCGADSCPANCVDGDCKADFCCDPQCTGSTNTCSLAGLCGGQGKGTRFIELSGALNGKAADTVVGSVCNPGEVPVPAVTPPPATLPTTPPTNFQVKGFSSILARVAEVVKQPAGLHLPTQPASAELTLLRIAGADGKTRKTCNGPAPAATLPAPTDPGYAAAVAAAVAAAEASGKDWWFTGGDDTNRAPTGPTQFIYLNRPTHNCEANPGETYSADYLGLVPAAGCAQQSDCQREWGGVLEDWRCCAGFDAGGACLPPTAITKGSCLCAARP